MEHWIYWHHSYPEDHVKYYLARKDNKYIGITGIYNYDSDSAWLAWFGILDEFRGKGFGREVLQKTCVLAANMGFKNMRLYTDYVDNHNAIKLYEKEGFVGEKYTLEKLPYDCRIYSKSLVDDKVGLWNNKDLELSYQTNLDHMNQEKINAILKKYDEI